MEADDLLAESLNVFFGFPLKDALQLVGRAGEHQDVDAALLKGAAGGRAGGVGEDGAVFRQPRLLEVILRHGDMHGGLEEAADDGLDLRVVDELPAEALRHHGFRQVIVGGAEAAGGDDDVCPLSGDGQDLPEALRIVPHHGVVADADAQGVELLGEVLGVGVGDAAQQQLRANGDDLGGVMEHRDPSFALDSGETLVRQADEGAVVLDADPLDAGEGLFHEGVHIQGALGGGDILDPGAGVRMAGGERRCSSPQRAEWRSRRCRCGGRCG